MTFFLARWLKAMNGRAALGAHNRRRVTRTHPTRFAPRLEPLEDRRLLSVYAVINTNDSGVGSLRQAILDANAHTSEANTIIFDIQGQGPQTIRPLTALPTITNPVTIDATFQPGYAGTPLIELDGSALRNADGLTINADNSVVRGLDITGFISGAGVRLPGHGDHIEACYLGTDLTGTQRMGNDIGVLIFGSDDLIGGTGAGAGNLISGNFLDGIDLVLFSSGNLVQGNLIGTDVTGTQALGNGNGVFADSEFAFSGGGNTIGGTVAGAGNLISGNHEEGIVLFSSGNLVQGNLIGTDVTGTQALGNGEIGSFGVGVSAFSGGNTIGGTVAGAGNLISGNFYGITLEHSGNLVQGNRIGTDVTGTQVLGDGEIGVFVDSQSEGNTIGGTVAGAGNLISGNHEDGVQFYGSANNLVQGNLIGTDITGTQALGNGVNGVRVLSGSNNTIGGTASGAGNTIAFNGNDGVFVDTGTGNAILGNLIFANSNLGIELVNNGNHNQAAPVLTGAFPDGPNTVIQGVLQSTANTTFTVQLFSDPSVDASGSAEGQQLLGTVTVTTDAFGFAAFTVTVPDAVPAGQVITATATDAGNNTSEFSAPVTVTGA